MHFDWKMSVGGLYPVTGSYTPTLIGHLLLSLKIPYLLDNAV